MKVYELMSKLAECSSGAEVKCSASLTTSELERKSVCGKDDSDDDMYSICENICSVESYDDLVCLNF